MILWVVCLGLLNLLAAWSAESASSPPAPSGSPPPDTASPTPSITPPVSRSIPAHRQASNIAVLTIHGGIDGMTLKSLERRIAQAKRNGADAIVLDIDTFGGELTSTLDICTLIKDPTETPPNIVAWINPKAYSAGSIIALACREIVFHPNASFGDAAPISTLMPLPLTERAKLEAPILNEVTDSARRNHYDENLVQAFISVGVELWLLEHIQTGERVFVTRHEYERVFGEVPPDQLTPVAPPQAHTSTPVVSPWIQEIFDLPEDQSDHVIMTEEERAAMIEREQFLPPVRLPLTEDARGQWKLITQVTTNDRLLTITPGQAFQFGLTQDIIANDAQLMAFFGATSLTRYDRSWSEGLVRFLISMPVRAILLVIFLIAFFIEIAVPGMGVFGVTAFIALLLLIGAPYLAGMAQWWDMALVVLGILLVLAEFFVIPGFGVAGVAGAACLLIGMIGTFVSGDVDMASPEGQSQVVNGLLTTLTAFLLAGAGIWIISRQMDTLPILNRVVLNTDLGQAQTTVTGGIGLLEAMGATTQRPLQPGDGGVAETDLRPSGKARFKDRIIDVKSIGEFISRGTQIRVVSVGRFAIEVEEAA